MRGARSLIPSIIVIGFVLLHTSVAYSWSLDLTGNFSWTHEFYNQTGHNGFFGPYDVDMGTNTKVFNLNFWNGGQFDTNLVTGSTSGWSYFNVSFDPRIIINSALKMQARFRLGTYGDPWNTNYNTFDAPGVKNAFSDAQFTLFWLTAVTPVGTLTAGKRPWKFGMGLQYDGEDAATTESVALVVPYGPFDIGVGYYPYTFVGTSSVPLYGLYFDPYDIPVYRYDDDVTVHRTQLRQYFSRADGRGSLASDFLAFLTYSSGPVSAGIVGSYAAYHVGPEAVLLDGNKTVYKGKLLGNDTLDRKVAVDSSFSHGSIYTKYNNGRIFANAEAAWLYWTDRWSAAPNARIAPPPPLEENRWPMTQQIEQWKYAVEVGAIFGPTKLSLLNAWSPGLDRRNGTLIWKQSGAFGGHPSYDRLLGNFDVFRPYCTLFCYNYGSGLNAYNLSNDGYLRDASVLAARLDYAVATNLNIYGTFFYANRTSNGYSWGCIGPNLEPLVNSDENPPYIFGNFPNTRDGNLDFNFNRYPTSPNIPDTSLGYEINAGLDWKLLEGMIFSVVMGYWQPGKWFNYACIDRSVPGWQNGSIGNNFGVRPDRLIDPVYGGQISLSASF